jgi:hypothetical protein
MRFDTDKELTEQQLTKLLAKYSSKDQDLIRERLYKRPSCYIGSHYFGTISVVGSCRDSSILELSNFETALEQLGGETKSVQVSDANHWAVGWVKGIHVHISNVKRTKQALDIIRALENYPVLDDSDYSEREYQAIEECFEDNKTDFQRELFKYLEFKNPEVNARNTKRKQDIEELTNRAYHYACSWSGYEDAWVNERSLNSFFRSEAKYILPELIKNGNRLAKAIAARKEQNETA